MLDVALLLFPIFLVCFSAPPSLFCLRKKNVKRKWYLNQVLCVYNFEIAINVELRARAVQNHGVNS